nr:hypothetical protein GTC16762_23790 [Pigmentibacter ruber]
MRKVFGKKNNQHGFSLFEIIIVLALIGTIAVVIIPNLKLSVDSQMSTSLRNLTAQIRSAYDDAIFSGRMHRMVFDIKNSEFWVEQAPLGYEGRPPLLDSDSESESLQKRDKRAEILKILDEKYKDLADRPMPTTSGDNKNYSIRSIAVVQRKVLKPVDWKEINDAVIYRQKLSSGIIFAQVLSSLSAKKFDYVEILSSSDKTKKEFAYIYFLPNGTATSTSIKLAMANKDNPNTISETGPKYTLNLNSLTGECNLLEGFQDANFSLPKR